MSKFGDIEILEYLTEYLIFALSELATAKNNSDFINGEFWAYIDCLEALSMWSGFTRFKTEDIEQQFCGELCAAKV